MNSMITVSTLAAAAFALIAADTPPASKAPAKQGQRSPASIARSSPRASHQHAVPAGARVAAANRSATLQPASQGFINAVQIYPYTEGLLYQVYTAPGRVTDIALEPGEALVAVASGDTVRWVIGDTSSGSGMSKRTHILVKPFASDLSTNLVITTDRRSYHLALTSNGETAMAALSWTYPQDALIALKHAEARAAAAAPLATGIAIDQLRFGYVISGDKPDWRPLRAFDDGRQTFIEFPATLGVGEAPPLFLVDRKGDAQLVNYRLRGRFYIVDRLFDAAELRLGTKRQDVVRIRRTAGKRDGRKS